MGAIVGRDAEAAAIQDFLDRARGAGRALILEGPAGIGKSTLWLEAVAAARERGFAVLASRPAERERNLENVVLGDLFGETVPEHLAILQAPRRRALETALLRRDEAGVPIDPRALGVALATLLRVLATDRSLLVAIDDDQWMDASSASTLSFALRRLADRPISLLLSRRSPETPPTSLEDAFAPESVERLAVGPLSVGALNLLVRERVGAVLSRPMQVRLHELSAGNPFHALELARAHAATSSPDEPGFAVPPSLEGLVGARLGALDAETREALLLVAAHGRLPTEALDVLGVPSDALGEARGAGIVETVGGTLRFTHPVLASAIYAGATEDERRAAHRRLVEVGRDPVHRARHLALAADGPDAGLAATIEAASGLARERGSSIAAAELAEHALRRTPPDEADNWRRRAAAAARALAAAGDVTRARAVAAELLERAPAGGPRAAALVVASELEPPAVAVELLERALREARHAPRLQAAIHAGLAENGYFGLRDRVPYVERHARAALRIAEELDDDGLRAKALSTLALDRLAGGRRGALELAERGHRLAAGVGGPDLSKRTGTAVGHVLTWIGETDRARDWLHERLAEWSDRDEPARADALWYLALVELWAGQWDLAADAAAQSMEISAEYGRASPFDAFPAALVALHRGDLDRARSLAEQSLAIGGESQGLKGYHGILGTCALWSSDPEAANANFVRAEATGSGASAEDPSMRYWLPEHVAALLELGRVAEAARLVDEWEQAGRRLGRRRVLAHAVRLRGLIAGARGDPETAIELLYEAAERLDAAGDPFGRARALLALGVARRRARQKRSAREALESALAAFAALGAAGWAAVARSELQRIGGRVRMVGLSPSELSVATLVAEGRTNREIAARLFLGERTVATHLTHIYSKLGVRSRTELARRLASKVQT